MPIARPAPTPAVAKAPAPAVAKAPAPAVAKAPTVPPVGALKPAPPAVAPPTMKLPTVMPIKKAPAQVAPTPAVAKAPIPAVAKAPIPAVAKAPVVPAVLTALEPTSVTLDIADGMSVIYYPPDIESYRFFPLIEGTEEDIDVEDARFILNELLTQPQIDALDKNTTVIHFIDSPVEFNLFNPDGYHYQDMKLTIPGVVTDASVEGYIKAKMRREEAGEELWNYLYSFQKPDGSEGYLCILHHDGPGYGSNVSTRPTIIV